MLYAWAGLTSVLLFTLPQSWDDMGTLVCPAIG
jgi:hypothetical protein